MMTESKQRLRPWLENILNENTVPGVCWLDDERTTFKIPWKHSGKQDWQPEDAKIFMVSGIENLSLTPPKSALSVRHFYREDTKLPTFLWLESESV